MLLMACGSVRRLRRAALPSLSAPTVIDSALTAQKEGEGTSSYSAALTSDGTAGRTLLSWVGVRTSLFAGPVTGNNGNTHTEQFSQAFPSPFTQYSLRGYRAYSVAGGSAHAVTGSKSSGTTEEATIALLALSGGTITQAPSPVLRAAAGAGATHTSPEVTVSGNALLVAVACGDGDVNATAPAQTWPGTWTVHKSVAYNSTQAPNGHIPLYLATRSVGPGTYSVGVQVAINEGLLMAIYAVQV